MKAALDALSDTQGAPLPSDLSSRLRAYLALIARYGQRTNLVGSLDEAFLETQIAVASLQLLRVGPLEGELVDVGSGAGVPGIPLALACPQLRATLVERRQKRATFIQMAVDRLDLGDRVTVLARDARDLGDTFDWAVSRAVEAPSVWMARARTLVRPGGHIGVYTTQTLWGEATLPDGLALTALAEDPTGSDRVVVSVTRAL